MYNRLDAWENGVLLAEDKIDEINQMFEDQTVGDVLFCLLAFTCHEIRNMEQEIRRTALDEAHMFLERMLENDL